MKIKFLGIIALLLTVTLVSCNRELPNEQGDIESRTVNYSQSELSGDLVDMNETFQILGKEGASNLSYTYKAYGEPPIVNGIPTNATSVTSINDMVFVTWHTLNSPYGGSITAYKSVGIGRYTFTDRIDFLDTDFHEAAANRNPDNGTYELFAVGQRDPDQSGYLLTNHRGAVVTRIDYDYISDAFIPSTFNELPLPGFAGNDIVAAAGDYYIVTGNGNANSSAQYVPCGIFRTDYSLRNVSEFTNLNDGIAVVLFTGGSGASSTRAEISVLDRTGLNQFRVSNPRVVTDGSGALNNNLMSGARNINTIGTNVERGGLTWAIKEGSTHWTNPDSLLVATGESGLYTAKGDFVVDYGTCLSTAYDAGARVIYYAGGDGGLYVLAADGYNGGALINTFDLVGIFTPPTGGAFPSQYDIKNVSVYGSRNIALATGNAGVYFIYRN